MTTGTLVIPLGLFLEEPRLGDEFTCQLRVRVIKLEEELVDVSTYGDQLARIAPSERGVTMSVSNFVRSREDS